MENVISMVAEVLRNVVAIMIIVNLIAKCFIKKINPLSYEKRFFIAFALSVLVEAIEGAANVYYGEPYKINAILMWLYWIALESTYLEIRKMLKENGAMKN